MAIPQSIPALANSQRGSPPSEEFRLTAPTLGSDEEVATQRFTRESEDDDEEYYEPVILTPAIFGEEMVVTFYNGDRSAIVEMEFEGEPIFFELPRYHYIGGETVPIDHPLIDSIQPFFDPDFDEDGIPIINVVNGATEFSSLLMAYNQAALDEGGWQLNTLAETQGAHVPAGGMLMTTAGTTVDVRPYRYSVTRDGVVYEVYCVHPNRRGPRQSTAYSAPQRLGGHPLAGALRNNFPANPNVSEAGDEQNLRNVYATRVGVAMVNNPDATFTYQPAAAWAYEGARDVANGEVFGGGAPPNTFFVVEGGTIVQATVIDDTVTATFELSIRRFARDNWGIFRMGVVLDTSPIPDDLTIQVAGYTLNAGNMQTTWMREHAVLNNFNATQSITISFPLPDPGWNGGSNTVQFLFTGRHTSHEYSGAWMMHGPSSFYQDLIWYVPRTEDFVIIQWQPPEIEFDCPHFGWDGTDAELAAAADALVEQLLEESPGITEEEIIAIVLADPELQAMAEANCQECPTDCPPPSGEQDCPDDEVPGQWFSIPINPNGTTCEECFDWDFNCMPGDDGDCPECVCPECSRDDHEDGEIEVEFEILRRDQIRWNNVPVAFAETKVGAGHNQFGQSSGAFTLDRGGEHFEAMMGNTIPKGN